jgi:hypothetical protein
MYLAQVNIGRILAPMESETMSGFRENLDLINRLAESHNGFIWRLKDESNNATNIKFFEDDFMLLNMSVWADKSSLFKYVYESQHVEFLKRKKEWFTRLKDIHIALWYVEENHTPNPKEAIERLTYLKNHGPSKHAFGFKDNF